MPFKTFIKIQDILANGKLGSSEFIQAHSLLQAFIAALSVLGTAAAASIKSEDDSTIIITLNSCLLDFNSVITDDTKGIIIGTSATAVSLVDNKLGAKIYQGTGAGQMEYSAVTLPTPYTVLSPSAYFDIARTFTNNSGNTIIINEAGILCKDSLDRNFLIDRSLYNKTVITGSSILITYRFLRTV